MDTNKNTNTNATTVKNYAAEFYKNPNVDLSNFFAAYVEDSKLTEIKREIQKLNHQIIEKTAEYTRVNESKYNAKFTPVSHRIIIDYDSNTGKSSGIFNFSTGFACQKEDDDIVYNCGTKNGELYITVGYAYELASVIVRHYKYYINTNNTQIRFVLQREIVAKLVGDEKTSIINNNGEIINAYFDYDYLAYTPAEEFVRNFYGIENFSSGLDLKRLRRYNTTNASTEIILRSIPDDITRFALLDIKAEKPVPLHTLVGLDKATYNKCIQSGNLIKFLTIRTLLGNIEDDYTRAEFLKKLGYSYIDWCDFIDKCNAWEEDLRFYNINFEGNLAKLLIGMFFAKDTWGFYSVIFPKYYKFGKWCQYIIEECINQGYFSVKNFATDLRDYIKQCEDLRVNPTLFSSYLKQTHDIMSRNHKIKLDEIQNEQFKVRYEKVKNVELEGGYTVVAPKEANDLQKEGDELNHCVASYIKRVIDDKCRIFFLRKTAELAKSLVTFEVANNAIVQARGAHNRAITEIERNALNKYAAKAKLQMKV